jgi:multidrug efflux pump
MSALINYAITHARLTLATLAFLLVAGLIAYVTIPKEAEPDVKVPIIYVQLTQRGISPEDAERLLLRPVETQLKSVSNVKEMRSTGYEGGGYVLLEFEAGFNSDAALADVRAKVDQAKSDLPKDADEPSVQEVNLSLYPVLVVTLAGDLPERTLLRIARDAKNQIEQQPGVLKAELRGARDEAVEITAEPMLMKSYGISLDQLIAVTQGSNSLIAAGALEGSSGRFAVKVPGLIEQPQDMLKIPVTSTAGATVSLGDVATVRPTFKDATSITRVNGRPAMTIEVSKRTGANLIETVDVVKKQVAKMEKTWPAGVKVGYTQDKSKLIRQMLADLQNSVATGVLLVAVIILFAVHRHCDPGVIFGWRLGAATGWPDGQHRGAVLAHPGGRHAGRRRHHRLGICRAPYVGRHAAETGLCASRHPHGRPGHCRHRDPHRRLLAAIVLARRGRPVHEIYADYADRDAVGVAGGGVVLHADARRAIGPGVAGRA